MRIPKHLMWMAAPLAIAVACGVFAIVAAVTRSSAHGALADAERALAEVEQIIADRTADEADLVGRDTAAATELDDLAVQRDDARSSVDEIGARLAETTRVGPGVVAVARAYPDLVDNSLLIVESQIAAGTDLIDLRRRQIEAGIAGDYDTFNALAADYVAVTDPWNTRSADLASILDGLPGFVYEDLGTALPGLAVTMPPLAIVEVTPLAPPTGPARIVGSLPSVLPCAAWGETGCKWDFEITWTETNMLGATITEIGRRYIDRRGAVWASTSGEWHDADITIAPGGTASYDSWVRTAPEERPDLENGTLVLSWRGIDAEGHTFSGQVRASLAPRD